MTTAAVQVRSTPAADTLAAPPAGPRLWPALILVAAYWVAWAIMTIFFPATFVQFLTLFYSPMVLGLGIFVWWLAFSRIEFRRRLWGLSCVVLGGFVGYALAHKSMNWMGLLMYAVPLVLTGEVLWLVVTRGAATRIGWVGLAAVSVLAWGYFTLLRVDGVTAGLTAERSFRWSPTAEDKFLAEQRKLASEKKSEHTDQFAPHSPSQLVVTAADWPEFRGRLRDGHVQNISLDPNWTTHPPREIWRRRVGPGWSSFAVIGDHVFTQEQRGEAEAVLCFDLANGQEIWSHEDKSRFWEVVSGAGPRATPTFHEGQLYTLGGSGKLNCLDAATGRPIWSRDVAADADTKPPQWGFSSSPLVAQRMVTVFAGGKDGKSVLAYDATTGQLKWSAGKGTHSYSSPQLLKLGPTITRSVSEGPADQTQARSASEGSAGGDQQLLMVSDHGLESFDPATGKLLWDHKWYLDGMFRVCQPHVLASGQILIGTGMGTGTRLVTLAREGDDWKVTEDWTTKDLKPYFNDGVSFGGHLYGFDGDILVCLDLATGKKKWKKGRYGHGQVLLVGDQGLLLILSDTGEAILAEATPKDLVERGRFQALAGKTWNHPVIAGNKLLLRNGEEMACYALAPGSASTDATVQSAAQ